VAANVEQEMSKNVPGRKYTDQARMTTEQQVDALPVGHPELIAEE